MARRPDSLARGEATGADHMAVGHRRAKGRSGMDGIARARVAGVFLQEARTLLRAMSETRRRVVRERGYFAFPKDSFTLCIFVL